ncbi:MAG: hypothetical protein J2P37_29010, partial [Ktedonobacteraceae bacterium]|nr:hypothetical protein [Ktedonobacteraceae bacterium]
MYKQQTKPENLPATEHQPPEAITEKSGATADTPVPGEEEVSTQQSPTEEKGNSDAAPQSNTPTLVTASPRPFEVRRSPLFKITRLLLAILAGLLIISGFTFILYATSAQYQGSLHIFGTMQAQSTQRVVNATQRAVQG